MNQFDKKEVQQSIDEKTIELKYKPALSYHKIYQMVNIAGFTPMIKTITLPIKYENGVKKTIRPQLHFCIEGHIGSAKSSILYSFAKFMNINVWGNMTIAALVGTFSKDGERTSPLAWSARNSCLLVDDYHISDRPGQSASHNSLLTIMESQGHYRKLGYPTLPYREEDKTDSELFLELKDSAIFFKTNFVFGCSSMQSFYKSGLGFGKLAFKSRILLLGLRPDRNALLDMAMGKITYDFKKYSPEKHVVISKSIYNKMINLVSSWNISDENFLRTIGDLCRIYAVVGYKPEFFEPVLVQRKRMECDY